MPVFKNVFPAADKLLEFELEEVAGFMLEYLCAAEDVAVPFL
jgi:hypothetical protein